MKTRTLILILLLIGVASITFAADRFAVATGSWDNISTWSATLDGAPGASIPVSGDVVHISEGINSYTVFVPSGNHGCAQIIIGSPFGNATSGGLSFDTGFSLLTVTGSIAMYRSTDSMTRSIYVGSGTLTVNGSFFLSFPGLSSNPASICSLIVNGGTITVGDLNFNAAAGFPLQSQVVFLGPGLMNVKGNLNLVNGSGTLTPSSGTVNFNGAVTQNINGGPDILFYNLNVDNASGIVLSGLVRVDGTWTQAHGTISGTPPNVDGFTSAFYYNIAINADDNMMNGFSIDMTTPALYPNYIDRQWALTGSYTGVKTVAFYWNDVDDHNHDWTGLQPAVDIGGKRYVGSYNVSTLPHYIQVTLDANFTKGVYRIALDTNETLPVELSSFTAIVTPQNFIKLDWVTQSETGVSGYYIYRNTEDNLVNAEVVSPLISAANTSLEQFYSFTDYEIESGTYYYWLQNMDMDGHSDFHGSINVSLSNNDGEIPPPIIPTMTGLENIYPNPFNPVTTVAYNLAKAGNVTITVCNIKGQLVRTLVSATKQSGTYRTNWNGKDEHGTSMPSGIYYIKMISGKDISSHKAILLK